MLSQLMVLFGFFSLVLVLVYWINRAVVLFDQLIADGQSAGVFLEFTALSLPSVMRLALPLAAFAAAVYVTNRMSTESELTVVQAAGYSPFRLARPVFYFGVIVALMMSVLMHFLVPMSSARLEVRQTEIAQNVTARLLTEGQFIEPVNGVTFYIREITPAGELLDIFLSDTRSEDEQITYTAAKAFLVRENATTQLVMINGMVQTLRGPDQRLFTTSFADFAYNISNLIGETSTRGRRDAHLSTWELLNPTPELEAETRRDAARLIARGHDRFSQSILGIVAALLGFSALMVGGYSRFGVWKQIVGAIFLIIVVKAVETTGIRIARTDPQLWMVTYLQSFVGFVMIWFLLFWAGRPYLFKRRVKEGAAL
ncbi:LPS export ABC transporter permease LptF [Yoonia sp. F2084L]|uniref:LPS export ABC transporter permease LptF n=1 Tax=Yoonia sp. F2084L TaxID=2926419 RepID=UPI001FF294B2|nr:LPS export ABC transporter permease LptF [Yoonia sp. F2084L]MCK0094333.1 LPS export ABC transporter permease LptF [Yoonia sp. F2084L]